MAEGEECENARELKEKFPGLNLTDKEANVAGLLLQYEGIDGVHHKQWCIDQVMRLLFVDKYSEFVRFAQAGEDGPNTYFWDEGIAP